MSIFVDGELSSYSFPTSKGLLDIVAEVTIRGSKLELRDPAVYSGDGSRVHLGVRVMLEIAHQVESLAKLQGFTLVLVTGKRLTGATPGRGWKGRFDEESCTYRACRFRGANEVAMAPAQGD